MKETVLIRAETGDDHAAIRRVNELAFGRKNEADLVDALGERARAYISLVAIVDCEIVGHIFPTRCQSVPKPHTLLHELKELNLLPHQQS